MIHPPKWADNFLSWYCNPDIIEEVQGDAHELFQKRVRDSGPLQAKALFIWDVIRFFRWSNIKRTKTRYSSNSMTMFKSYLTVGFRNALRHRLNTSINLLGLSLALGVAITSFIFIDNQLNADQFHTKMERIYQVTNNIATDNRVDDWSDTPASLGPALSKDQSAVEASTRIEFVSAAVRLDEKVFNEFMWYTDPAFMTIFDFPVIAGDRQTLDKKNHLILESEIAEKYFGKTDPVGQVLSIKFDEKHKEEFVVGAVIERPTGSSLYPQIILPMSAFEDQHPVSANSWSYQVDATFILLKPSHNPSELLSAMEGYQLTQNQASPQSQVSGFVFHPLKGLSLHATEIISAVSNGAHPAGLISLGVVSALLLLLASFNYMNVSVATVATRLKEIGIRKVIGGQKKEIIQQFLTENFLLCAFSMILGTLLAYVFLLPGFNSLYPISIPFEFSSGNAIFFFFGGLLLVIGFISGAYPAFYISSFTPISIMRGREKFGQKSIFSRVLLTFQFVLAFMTIVGSFVFIDNSLYLKGKDWGYNHEQIIAVPVGDKEKFLSLRDKLTGNQNINEIGGSANHIGDANTRASFTHLENRHEIVDYRIGFDYLETMNIRLKEGRLFDRKIASDEIESIIINESFAEKMGWDKPIGQTIEFDSVRRNVIGVVEDFHYEGFYNALGPVLFRITPEDNYRYLVVNVKESHVNETQEQIKAAWASVAPDDPYEGFLQNDVFSDFNNDNNANVKLLGFISSVTVVLASLGLFGLVSFNITRRMKEFSIRKVFGALMPHIFKLMNRDYVWILSIAFAIGAPAGFFLINTLIQNIYPDPQAATPLPFLLAVSIMLMTVAFTVGSQLRRVRKENPAATLRND